MRVLVVEDSSTMRAIVRGHLEELGARDIIECADAEAAQLALSSQQVELIILDWRLPGRSGLEFLTALRSEATFARLPVVMLSSEAEKSNIVRALRAGANDYIIKPFSHETLARKVASVLGKPKLERAGSPRRIFGNLGQTPPADLVRFIASSRKTGLLEMATRMRAYVLQFRDGKLVAAEGPESSGEAAALDALSLEEGNFSFRPVKVGTGAIENVRAPVEHLVLEAARKKDER